MRYVIGMLALFCAPVQVAYGSCDQLDNPDEVEFCSALQRRSTSNCHRVQGRADKGECLALVGRSKSYCNQISDYERRSFCTGAVVLMGHRAGHTRQTPEVFCAVAHGRSGRAFCEAALSGSEAKCRDIWASEFREVCASTVQRTSRGCSRIRSPMAQARCEYLVDDIVRKLPRPSTQGQSVAGPYGTPTGVPTGVPPRMQPR